MTRTVVAVVGPGEGATPAALEDAAAVGRGLAERGWVTLTGGRAAGVMAAATRGAAVAGGLTVGLLPDASRDDAAPELAIALATGLGEARNAVIATAADALVVCGTSAGTASEIALALRMERPVVLVRPEHEVTAFFQRLVTDRDAGGLQVVESPAAALRWLDAWLGRAGGNDGRPSTGSRA